MDKNAKQVAKQEELDTNDKIRFGYDSISDDELILFKANDEEAQRREENQETSNELLKRLRSVKDRVRLPFKK